MSLTVKDITDALPGDVLRDDQVRGLHLRAFPNRKTFYLYYRTKTGEERRPKVGDYGVLTINDARRIARRLLIEVAEGKDPSGNTKAARAGLTVNELIAEYEKRVLPKRRSARSIKIVLAHVRKHLGTKKVASLDLPDVEALHAAISLTAPIQANRAVATVSALLTLAERLQARPLNSNFCKLVERNPETKRKRYLRPGDEARAIGAALGKRLYGEQHEAALFIILLLLTGARKSEIGQAKEVQRQGDKLILTDHKTAEHIGAKTIYLPKAAVELLDDPLRPQHIRRGYLVGVADPRALWDTIRAECGVGDLRLHDLRHTFASIGIGADVSLSQVGALLGHTTAQTTKRYEHLIDDPARLAVNKIGETVTNALGLD